MNFRKPFTISLAAILHIAASTSMAAESVTYDVESGRLFIPSVSAPGLPGAIQNVVLENIDGENFRLSNMWNATRVNSNANVELISKGTGPVNYYLSVEGFISRSLGLGRAVQALEENTIYVDLYYEPDLETCVLCLDDLIYFEKIIPLDVYDLEAGEYSIVFDGSVSESFTLESKNVLE